MDTVEQLVRTGEQSDERKRGVVAFSSGNHARGVAIAARRLGIPATIVMPSDAPVVKVEGTRSEGAEIVFYDRRAGDRAAIAAELAAKGGATVVPSFDDAMIVAGQGTVGLEIAEELGGDPPAIIVPVGGGGLAAGIARACPGSTNIGAEPKGWDDMRRSIEGGEIVPVGPNAPSTICDALMTTKVSPITFYILRERKTRIVAVSDDDVELAVLWAYEEHGLTVEPGGAAALAAVLADEADPLEGGVIILSGGNIDPTLHASIVFDGL